MRWKQIVLDDIQTGYLGWYGDSKLILHAEGRYLTKGNDGYIVNSDATAKKIVEKLSNFNYINEVIELETIQKSPGSRRGI